MTPSDTSSGHGPSAAASAGAVFETESELFTDDRAVVCWRYDWGSGHVRGLDLFVVRDGLVAEKRSYVKG